MVVVFVAALVLLVAAVVLVVLVVFVVFVVVVVACKNDWYKSISPSVTVNSLGPQSHTLTTEN